MLMMSQNDRMMTNPQMMQVRIQHMEGMEKHLAKIQPLPEQILEAQKSEQNRSILTVASGSKKESSGRLRSYLDSRIDIDYDVAAALPQMIFTLVAFIVLAGIYLAPDDSEYLHLLPSPGY